MQKADQKTKSENKMFKLIAKSDDINAFVRVVNLNSELGQMLFGSTAQAQSVIDETRLNNDCRNISFVVDYVGYED